MNSHPLLMTNKDAVQTVLDILSQWQQQGWIRPLDRHFALLLRDLASEPAPLVLLLAALTSHQVGRGHVCLDLGLLTQQADAMLALPPDASISSTLTPVPPSPETLLAGLDLETFIEVLGQSEAVSQNGQARPLALADERLYLHRFWCYEQQVARGISQRLETASIPETDNAEVGLLRQVLDTLFGSAAAADAPDFQKIACALAARNRFSIITGGPGTGKTTTVVKLLAALQAVAASSGDGRRWRIRLAAPTGKAAARLNESIGGAIKQLPLAQLPGQLGEADIPSTVTTLHRLLGGRPDTRQFRYHRDQPLPLDMLVVDEASMVDLDLMAAVFEALPDHARLVLLGDKDQLASVDAGAVLGDLCRFAEQGRYRPATAEWLQQVTGYAIDEALQDSAGADLDQAVAMLRKSYRFEAGSGIGQLAQAVNRGQLDADMAQAARASEFPDVAWLKTTTDLNTDLGRHAVTGSPEAFHQGGQGRVLNGEPLSPPVGYRHYLTLLKQHPLNAHSAQEQWDQLARAVLDAFAQFQLLCALRQGPWGVETLNDTVAQALHRAGLIPRTQGWYPGRPVMITANDYNLGLMNGDIGITMEMPDGPDGRRLRVAFPAADGGAGIRWISPSRLQQLETVYAMTVHKSQGSEFSHGCLVLPDRLNPVLTRELIYTGITRARHWFSLWGGSEALLRAVVERQVLRTSGLANRLRRTPAL